MSFEGTWGGPPFPGMARGICKCSPSSPDPQLLFPLCFCFLCSSSDFLEHTVRSMPLTRRQQTIPNPKRSRGPRGVAFRDGSLSKCVKSSRIPEKPRDSSQCNAGVATQTTCLSRNLERFGSPLSTADCAPPTDRTRSLHRESCYCAARGSYGI